jgi:hypothetical protein
MVKNKFEETQKAITSIRKIRSQIETFTSRSNDLPQSIKDKAQSVILQITSIEETLHQTKAKSGQDVLNFPIRLNDKLSSVYDVASSGYNKPSKQAKEVYQVLAQQIDVELNKLTAIKSKDIKELNDMITANAIPIITTK